LLASSTEENSTIFTSWRDDNYGGDTNEDGLSSGETEDWKGLYFKDSFNSKLKNIIIKYTGGFLNPHIPSQYGYWSYLSAIHINEGNVAIKNATITESVTRGIWLENSSSTLDNIIISGTNNSHSTENAVALFISGGAPIVQNSFFSNNETGIKIKDSEVVVKNCTFLNNSIGIKIDSGTSEIRNNTFENNGLVSYISLSASPIFSENFAQTLNNGINGIFVGQGETKMTTSTWYGDLPYVIKNNLSIPFGATLFLQPKTVIKIGSKIFINISGRILAQSTTSQPIIITSIKDDGYGGDTNNDGIFPVPEIDITKDWWALRFYSSTSLFDGVIIRYGGQSFKERFGAVDIDPENHLSIQNSIFENNSCAMTYTNMNCEVIVPEIEELIAEKNVIFRYNDHNTHPQCY